MFQCFLLLLVLLLPLSGGTSKGHLVDREAKVIPLQEVPLHFLEARCVPSVDKIDSSTEIDGHVGTTMQIQPIFAMSCTKCHLNITDPVMLKDLVCSQWSEWQ